MLWDLQGEAEDQAFRPQYLRGAAAVLVVADGTKMETLEPALRLLQTAHTAVGPVPHVLLLNKRDLEADWAFSEEEIARLRKEGHIVFLTSAKTGEGVEEAFHQLVEKMIG
jgi:small GTP-binding protein